MGDLLYLLAIRNRVAVDMPVQVFVFFAFSSFVYTPRSGIARPCELHSIDNDDNDIKMSPLAVEGQE